MQAGYLVQVLRRHTCVTGICRVGSQGHIGLFEPEVQGLGMNPKHLGACC
jgi:hypothetical protein